MLHVNILHHRVRVYGKGRFRYSVFVLVTWYIIAGHGEPTAKVRCNENDGAGSVSLRLPGGKKRGMNFMNFQFAEIAL